MIFTAEVENNKVHKGKAKEFVSFDVYCLEVSRILLSLRVTEYY